MSILENQLGENGSELGFKGTLPPKYKGSDKNSTLHYQSSINNQPAITRQPSDLDLDGVTPPKYLDNPPR